MLASLPNQSVHCCVTSPPYFGLRDYGVDGQIGLEQTPDAYVADLVAVFREVKRVLRDDGTLWLNLGDSYTANGASSNNLKQKDLIGIPWRVAFALQADGWYLRQDIIWHKPNPMPESVRDRCTKAHEYIFLLSKSARYYYHANAIAEKAIAPGVRCATPYTTNAVGSQSTTPYNGNAKDTRNKRSVWTVTQKPFKGAHFATFPPGLVEPCIKAGCPEGGNVLDPFGGAGTTGLVANRLGRNATLIELNPTYAVMAQARIAGDKLPAVIRRLGLR
jgi:DNA modification methylase